MYTNKLTKNSNSVKTPVVGREDEMVSAAGGHGFAFSIDVWGQLKRWLVMGSATDTMYDSADEMTNNAFLIIKQALSTDYVNALDIIKDFSLRNIAPKQSTLLVALSMALSYEDHTLRYYYINPDSNDWNAALSPSEQFHKAVMIDSISRVGMGDNGTLYVSIYDKSTGSNYRYITIDSDGKSEVKNVVKPAGIKMYERLFVNDKDRPYMVDIYSLTVRKAAKQIAVEMFRQSSQLFEGLANISAQRGWGPVVHGVIEQFYNDMSDEDLSYQLVKYGNRNGWSHRDLLRKVKPVALTQVRNRMYGWATGKWKATGSDIDPELHPEMGKSEEAAPLMKLWAMEKLATTKSVGEAAQLIEKYGLPRETIERTNNTLLTHHEIWDVLIYNTPAVALLRNLRRLASIGYLTPGSEAEKFIAARLIDPKFMRWAHPVGIIQAAAGYNTDFFSDASERTRKLKATTEYVTSPVIIDALEQALNNSFYNLKPTGKRVIMGVDTSDSMWWNMLKQMYPFYPGEAAAILAMVLARTEDNYQTYAFASKLEPIDINKLSTMPQIMRAISEAETGGTNIGSPIEYAITNKVKVDAFISVTDNQLNVGQHPSQLIKIYRDKMGIDARYIVLAMEANNISVADPRDKGMIDITGFSPDTPTTIINFINGEF